MTRYRVTALYGRPPLERTVELEAENAERAMVKALIERHVPAAFVRDPQGWLQPLFWRPALAGDRRWPVLAGPSTLMWGKRGKEVRLAFYVTELEPRDKPV